MKKILFKPKRKYYLAIIPIVSLLFYPILSASSGGLVFVKSQEIVVGNSPIFSGIADLNHDDNLDLVVGGVYSSIFISILFGNNEGEFSAPLNLRVAPNPHSVVIADLNKDGNLDLATANSGQYLHDVSVLLGDGTGSFSEPVHFFVGNIDYLATAGDIAVGDFDKDGNLDLAVPVHRHNVVSILFGDGTGNFSQPPSNFVVGLSPKPFPNGIEVADFDKDGNLDLAVAIEQEHYISILFGDGQGSFSNPVRFDAGVYPGALTVADLNQDGNQDLLTSHWSSGWISTLFGDGQGDFGDRSWVRVGGAEQRSVAVADFNGDRYLDLAAPHFFNNTVEVVLGDGTGHFTGRIFSFPANSRPRGVSAGDFNRDGLPDLVVANDISHTISIFLNATPPFIRIDIKPSSDPNCINSESKGSVPVAILTDDAFDASDVDPLSVKFAGASVDIRKNGKPNSALEDVDGDGDLDLVLHFSTQDLLLTKDDTHAILVGKTIDNKDIESSDSICIVPR